MNGPRASRVRWFLIFWLFILSAVSYLDRVNISIAGGSIAETYHLSDVQLGKIFSAFLVGYALFQTIGGRLADRFGPRRVLAGGVAWWGIFTALTALVPANIAGALLAFIAVRFFLGAGEAVIYPSANQFIARWIPTSERGIANGWIFAGVGAGAGFTPLIITYIMIHHGWRTSFWICSIIGFAAGAVWFVMARDTPAEHGGVSASELTFIHSGLEQAGTKDDAKPLVPWRRVLESKEVWAVTLSYFCYGYVAWIFFSWFYRYLAKVRGLDLKASAFYTMLPFLAMLVCCLLGGAINDRLTRRLGLRVGRCGLAAFAIAAAGGFIAFGSQVQSARLASVVLAGGAGALYSVAEFFLVGDGRHCRGVFGVGVRLHEYGESDWSRDHGYSHSLDRCPIRLDNFISGRGRAVRGRCGELAGSRSYAATQVSPVDGATVQLQSAGTHV